MYQYSKIGDTVYFHFASNSVAGDGTDGTTPLYQVREAGATGSNAPTLVGSPTLLSHASYPDGCYEVVVAATTANSFVEGRRYAVYCNLTVSGHNPSGFLGGFALAPVPALVESMAMGYKRVLKVGSGRQYSSLAAVEAVNSPGDLVVVYPGTYTDYPIGKTGVEYYFGRGAIHAPSDNDAVSWQSGNYRVFGEGTFTVAPTGGLLSIVGCTVSFECSAIDYNNGSNGISCGSGSQVDLKVHTLTGGATGPFAVLATGGVLLCEIQHFAGANGNLFVDCEGAASYFYADIEDARFLSSTFVGGTSGGNVVLSGNYTCLSTVSNGLNAPTGIPLTLLRGSVTVPAGRPSLSGPGKILVTEAFAYDHASATASAVVASRGEEILNRVPSAFGDFIETHVENALEATTVQLDADDVQALAIGVWNVLESDASLANSIGKGLVASNATLVKLLTALQQDGLVWQFTANALEDAPAPSSVTAQVDLVALLYSNSLTAVDYSGRTGLTTLKSVLIDKSNKVFNTSTNSFDTILDSITWATAIRTMSEVLGQSGAGMGVYRNAIPSQVPIGTYTVIVQDGAGPSAERLVTEMIFWDGQNVVPISGALSTMYSSVQTHSNLGTGSLSKTVTMLAHSGAPVPNIPVWISLDSLGQNKIAGPMLTDDLGQVTFMLNPGSYFAWGQGYNTNVVNPKSVQVP